MKREEVLAVLDSEIATIPVYRRWGKALGYAVDEVFVVNQLREVRAFIASALDDAERYRWLRDQSQDDISIRVESSMGSGRRSYCKVAGPGVDGLIDTARAAAAGGGGVL